MNGWNKLKRVVLPGDVVQSDFERQTGMKIPHPDEVKEAIDNYFTKPQRDGEAISRTADLTREGYCRWHGGPFSPGGHWNREALVKRGICELCEFWRLLWERRKAADSVRVNGEHYIIGEPNTGNVKGMYGRPYTVKFFDGRTVGTNDLWHQGKIPTLWRVKLPDNAEFIDTVEVKTL